MSAAIQFKFRVLKLGWGWLRSFYILKWYFSDRMFAALPQPILSHTAWEWPSCVPPCVLLGGGLQKLNWLDILYFDVFWKAFIRTTSNLIRCKNWYAVRSIELTLTIRVCLISFSLVVQLSCRQDAAVFRGCCCILSFKQVPTGRRAGEVSSDCKLFRWQLWASHSFG